MSWRDAVFVRFQENKRFTVCSEIGQQNLLHPLNPPLTHIHALIHAQICAKVHTMNIKATQKQKKQCYIAYEDHDAAMTAQVPLLVVDVCILDTKPDKLDLTTFSTPFFVSLGHSHHSHFSLGSTSFETVHINLTRLENKKSSTLERPHLGQDFDQPRCTTSICSRKDNGKIACSLKIGSKLGTS